MLASVLASEAGGHASAVGTSPLTAAIVLPFIGALAVALVPKARTELHRLVALLFSAGTGAITLWVMASFDRHDAGFQFVVDRSWISDFGISWHLGVDGISLFLVVLSGLLFPLAIVAVTPHHDPKPYYSWLLVLQAGCIGVFCALDLFVFFVMFEIVLVPMYFLIGGWGYAERVYAALKFFIFTMLGSALMLVGIVSLAFLHRDAQRDDVMAARDAIAAEYGEQAAAVQEEAQSRIAPIDAAAQAAIAPLEEQAQALNLDSPEGQAAFEQLSLQYEAITGERDAAIGQINAERDAELGAINEARDAELSGTPEDPALSFDLVEIGEAQHLKDTSSSANPIDWSAARWIFLAFAVAFAVKVPLFPLHTWLPDAHTQAPTAGSVILAGVMLKLGTYGFVRFGLYLFPEATVWFAPGLVTLGVIGIVYGAIAAAMQKDLKRLVAYSSVAHLGFIVLGTFALTTQGIQGSVLQMVNHGISTGALFLLVGMIYDRRHTREIAKLKGLQKSAPVLAGVFTVVMLSSIGLPGLNGFAGEYLILVGSFLTRRWWTVVAVTGVILAAVYLLWAYQRVFHGEPDEDNADTPDLTWKEGLVMAPLLGLIVFLGVYPKPVLDRIEPAVDKLVTHIEDNSTYRQPEVAKGSSHDDGADEGEGH
ncbi:MAG: NADH-quinone oxidoreductase subunit M [Actinomycetota bacterium]|nr:NADH-quinone oxidoreductase subunit M [Actinomycetota bacterium]